MPERVQRFDRMTQSLSGIDAATGMLRGRAVLARVGCFDYIDQAGQKHTEFVPPETLSDGEWLQSLKIAPVTLQHPPEPVTADNAKTYVVGALGDTVIMVDGKNLAAIKVMRGDAVDAVKDGVQEISCGYTCVLDFKSGEFEGQKYDAIQRGRRANHVAIVDRGRHGPTVRLNLDGAAEMSNTAPEPEDHMTDPKNPTHADACDKCDEWKDKFEKMKAARDALFEKSKESDKKADSEQAKAEAEKVKADSFAAGRARASLELKAQGVCGDEFKADGKTDRQINEAMLERLGVKLDADASDVYVQARLDTHLQLRVGKTAEQELAGGLRQTGTKTDETDEVPPHLEAIAKMQARFS